MEAEYSKRVYQGVRVKHTVKDLLAEKRSRQTSGPRFAVYAFFNLAPFSIPCGNVKPISKYQKISNK
ncbi:uncharacterized protein C11orf53 homolog [Tachysurus ichikawai]